MMMKKFQILANGDERGLESFGEIADQHPAVALQNLQNLAPSLFTQHVAGCSKSWNNDLDLHKLPQALHFGRAQLAWQTCQTVRRPTCGSKLQRFFRSEFLLRGVRKTGKSSIAAADGRAGCNLRRMRVIKLLVTQRLPNQPVLPQADRRAFCSCRDDLSNCCCG